MNSFRLEREVIPISGRLKNTYYIVGLPGIGKSGILKILSEDFGYPTVDFDELVEIESGKKPWQIIRDNGLNYYKVVERKVLKRISNIRGYIVTVGSVENVGDFIEEYKKKGRVLYLKTSYRGFLERWLRRIQRFKMKEKPNRKDVKRMYNTFQDVINGRTDFVIFIDNKSQFEIARIIDDYVKSTEKGKR